MAASNVVKASIATVLLQINNIDSESEEDELMLSMAIRQMEDDFKVKRRRIEKIENFVEVTVPLYNPSDFKQHFRLTKASFEILINKLYQLLQKTKNVSDPGRRPILPEKQLLCCLWTMANQESFRGIGDRFNISRRTSWNICNKVVDALLKLNEKEKICWPSQQDAKNTIKYFFSGTGFPGIVG